MYVKNAPGVGIPRQMIHIFTVLTIFALIFIVPVGPAFAAAALEQGAEAYTFADLPVFVDVVDSSLVRNDYGVRASTKIYGAPVGVFTMWSGVWNTQEGCITPWACDEPDLFNENAGVAIGYAGGAFEGDDNFLEVTAHLREGATLVGFAYPEFQAIGVELNNTT